MEFDDETIDVEENLDALVNAIESGWGNDRDTEQVNTETEGVASPEQVFILLHIIIIILNLNLIFKLILLFK